MIGLQSTPLSPADKSWRQTWMEHRDNGKTDPKIGPGMLAEQPFRDSGRFVIRRAFLEKSPEPAETMPERRKSWVNIVFLSLTPVIGIAGTLAYAVAFGVRWWEPALFAVLFGLVSFSVTAGYHRCFAHKAYTCHPALQAFYLFFGAMALQN
jgi:type IV secretory pathway TrbD component